MIRSTPSQRRSERVDEKPEEEKSIAVELHHLLGTWIEKRSRWMRKLLVDTDKDGLKRMSAGFDHRLSFCLVLFDRGVGATKSALS